MEFPYDHIQEEILSANDPTKKEGSSQGESSTNDNGNLQSNVDLNTELQETFRAFSASPWGARIGGLWDNVRKQSETYYEGARQEYAAASEEAVKGLSDLRESIVGRTRGFSLSTGFASGNEDNKDSDSKDKDEAPTPTAPKAVGTQGGQESESLFSRFKTEAAKRLRELEQAEEAADEAILRFGMNIRQKLQDAVSIVPSVGEESDPNKVLFESKDAEGKRVIHATRFEAQLHVIHSNIENFAKDPESEQWGKFKEGFNVDAKTGEIAAHLEEYPELRDAMEQLVPEKVEYGQFWSRYYFLRTVIEMEEQKRKELLKGANVNEEEEVAWDDDSEEESEAESQVESDSEESESESPATPQGKKANTPAPAGQKPQKSAAASSSSKQTLKPNEPRRSNDQQSQADSESSYDVVSGATSRTPGSPKEKSPATGAKGEDSDDDWE